MDIMNIATYRTTKSTSPISELMLAFLPTPLSWRQIFPFIALILTHRRIGARRYMPWTASYFGSKRYPKHALTAFARVCLEQSREPDVWVGIREHKLLVQGVTMPRLPWIVTQESADFALHAFIACEHGGEDPWSKPYQKRRDSMPVANQADVYHYSCNLLNAVGWLRVDATGEVRREDFPANTFSHYADALDEAAVRLYWTQYSRLLEKTLKT